MPRRPRELLDPHTRAKLRKRLRRVVPPPVADASVTPTIDDGFRDTVLCKWVRIPEDVAEQDASGDARRPNKPQQEKEDHDDEETDQFCDVLSAIKEDFKQNGRPYAALAADQGIQLVREGDQDDINPGLWAFVSAHEKKMREGQYPT